MHTLYRLKFASGKFYIGQTIRPLKTRMVAHRQAAKRDSQFPVHCAWRVHGEPEIEVIGTYQTHEELHAAEVAAIKTMNTRSPHGYNITVGGDTAPSKDPAVAAKISAKMKGRKHADPKRFTENALKAWTDPEYRAKVAAGVAASWTPERRAAAAERTRIRNTGKKHSHETIEKMRGPKSAETRERMSAAAKGKKKAPRSAETCAKLSAATAKAWCDTEAAAKRIASIQAAWTPERRAHMAEHKRAWHAAKQVVSFPGEQLPGSHTQAA